MDGLHVFGVSGLCFSASLPVSPYSLCLNLSSCLHTDLGMHVRTKYTEYDA